MALIIFEIVILGIIFVNYKLNKNIINPFTILTLPYVIIIPANNMVFSKYGFYEVNEEVIYMLLLGCAMFFIGTLITYQQNKIRIGRHNDESTNNNIALNYRMKGLLVYYLICETIVGIRLINIIRSGGIIALSTNEGLLLTGLSGHILLTIFPLNGVMLYHWLKNKKEWLYLVASVMCVIFYFLTFVKYHVIGLVICMYLTLAYQERKYLKKGAIFLVGIVVLLFVSNYYIGFFYRGVSEQITRTFYVNHFWKYIAGGLIYDNKIFDGGVYHVSVIYRIGTIIFALPNMFFNKIFGTTVCPVQPIPAVIVASNNEVTNVLDGIGYLYPSPNDIFGYFVFCIFFIIFGAISMKLFVRARSRRHEFPFAYVSFVTYFLFLSFFASYGKLETPWEVCAWSLIIPKFFDHRVSLENGVIYIRNSEN